MAINEKAWAAVKRYMPTSLISAGTGAHVVTIAVVRCKSPLPQWATTRRWTAPGLCTSGVCNGNGHACS